MGGGWRGPPPPPPNTLPHTLTSSYPFVFALPCRGAGYLVAGALVENTNEQAAALLLYTTYIYTNASLFTLPHASAYEMTSLVAPPPLLLFAVVALLGGFFEWWVSAHAAISSPSHRTFYMADADNYLVAPFL